MLYLNEIKNAETKKYDRWENCDVCNLAWVKVKGGDCGKKCQSRENSKKSDFVMH